MKITDKVQAPGGWWVTVEVPSAYTDGTSRFDKVFVPRDAVTGKTPEQVRQAVKDAVDDDPLAPLLGATVTTPTQTKPVFEDRMVAQYERWRRWQQTRVEAQSRALAAGVITALTNQENAAWSDYATAINSWRLAP